MKFPLVSICCQTYNHKVYIGQAIESFLMQKTNFKFEILLRDDASTDGTAEICKKYAMKFPNLINFLAYDENQLSKGVKPFSDNVKRAQGKYIALCEGDDYWTDPCKLQKQVDFLEQNPEYTLCAHQYLILNEDVFDVSFQADSPTSSQKYIEVNMNQLIQGHPFATHSIVFRKSVFNHFPNWLIKSPYGDYAIYFLCAIQGKLAMLNEVMGVYRKHANGIYTSLNDSSIGLITRYSQHIKFYKMIRKELKSYFTSIHDYLLYESILFYYNKILIESKKYNNIKYYFFLVDFLNFKLNEKVSRYFSRFKTI